MKLNRRRRNQQQPISSSTAPTRQFKQLLRQRGEFYIVLLPDEKSFVVKVTDDQLPFFATICQQLKGTLGYCQAVHATPVEARPATAQQIAEQTSIPNVLRARAQAAAARAQAAAADHVDEG